MDCQSKSLPLVRRAAMAYNKRILTAKEQRQCTAFLSLRTTRSSPPRSAPTWARWGFESRGVGDFQHVLAEFAAFDPQLVLMDISLPFFDGYHWCSEMRKVSKVPIVFISSASDNMNILMALSAGAG